MNIIGKEINHNTFGRGMIVNCGDHIISVQFGPNEKKFDLDKSKDYFNAVDLDVEDYLLQLRETIRENSHNITTIKKKKVTYTLTRESKPFYVYTNLFNLYCYQHGHNIIDMLITAKSLDGCDCLLPSNYCVDCDAYFIGKNSFANYRKRFGVILIKTCIYEEPDRSASLFSDFRQESDLHSYGYIVGRGGLPIANRRKLLLYLIDNKIYDKPYIRRDIEKSINMFRYRIGYDEAVFDWENDLRFIDEYGLNIY